MSEVIKKLREEFSTLKTEGLKLAEEMATRDLTEDETKANDARFVRMDKIEKTIAEQMKFAKKALEDGKVELPTEGVAKAVAERHSIEVGETERPFDRKRFSREYSDWVRTGNRNLFTDSTITTASQSGIFLPVGVVAPLVPAAVNSFRAAYQSWNMPVMNTPTTETLNIPVLSATAGGVVAENASSETENEPDLTKSILSVVKTYQSGSIYYSNQQLNATSFDLLSASVPSLLYSKELGLESAITAAMIADSGITQSVATSSVSAFTYANLVSLNRKLPKKFDQFKVIVLSQNAFAAAEGLTGSGNGQPILTNWVDGPQGTQLKSFNGTPVIRNDYLNAFGANNIVGFVFSLIGFHFRDAGQTSITRYDQVPAKPNQLGLNMFAYHAYGYDDDAVASLKCPAS